MSKAQNKVVVETMTLFALPLRITEYQESM